MSRTREFDTDQVLDAAMQTFWRHGYEATSLADLMDATGLQKGSIYKACGDKHSLFVATLQRYLDGMYEDFTGLLAEKPPAEALRLRSRRTFASRTRIRRWAGVFWQRGLAAATRRRAP